MEKGRETIGQSFDAVKLWTDDFDVFYATKVKLSGELEIDRVFKSKRFWAVSGDGLQFRVIPGHEEHPLRLQPIVITKGETFIQFAYPEFDEHKLTHWFRRGLRSYFHDKLTVMSSVRLMCFGPQSRDAQYRKQILAEKRAALRRQIGFARKSRKIKFGGWQANKNLQASLPAASKN